MFDLTGKTGIITGASGGIGLAAAHILAEAGAKVYALSRTGAPKAEAVNTGAPKAELVNTDVPKAEAKNTDASKGEICHIKADINDYKRLEQIVEEIGERDGIDFLINNAGVSVKKRAEEITDEEFDSVIRTNVSSVYKLSCLCYPYLKEAKGRGRIVNISSMAAHLGFSLVTPYCVSKSAVLGITRGLAIEWAEDNINVNSIAPGWFPSKLLQDVMDEERKAKILSRMPLHEFGETNQIGAMLLYLVADESGYVTGQDYAVDGGALAFGF